MTFNLFKINLSVARSLYARGRVQYKLYLNTKMNQMGD